ncbi:MAG TPA: LacI family DNA-binding transcriptional regulator [Solirubrobacter sp.]|nr:LacI family DNA-binding transcriptional regulator [Solirubrobacter sp.]
MKDVAALAGVSLSTVSRTVNGDRAVRADLAAKVRHAVELLGYQRDEAASALRRTGRISASIGIIVEDVANPFFSLVHRGVEDYARERRFLTFAGSSDDDDQRERDLAAAFVARRVDGLLIAPAGRDHRYLERERAAGVPLVFVDRPARWLEADAVVSDNGGGSALAVAHLVAAGHRRIAFLGDRPELYTSSERLAGYRAGLEAAGIDYDDELVRVGLDELGAHAAALELLDLPQPPTALFSAQNLVTIGVLRALHERGVREAVAHVGFDDVALADLLAPALTVIAQDPYELGRAAAETLFERLDGDTSAPRRILLATRLVPRGTGEIAAS